MGHADETKINPAMKFQSSVKVGNFGCWEFIAVLVFPHVVRNDS